MDTTKVITSSLQRLPAPIDIRPFEKTESVIACEELDETWKKDFPTLLRHLESLGDRSGEIRCLSATRLMDLSSNAAQQIVRCLPALEFLDITRCKYLSESALQFLLAHEPLKTLVITAASNLPNLLVSIQSWNQNLVVMFLQKVVWLNGGELRTDVLKVLFPTAESGLYEQCISNHCQARTLLSNVFFHS